MIWGYGGTPHVNVSAANDRQSKSSNSSKVAFCRLFVVHGLSAAQRPRAAAVYHYVVSCGCKLASPAWSSRPDKQVLGSGGIPQSFLSIYFFYASLPPWPKAGRAGWGGEAAP